MITKKTVLPINSTRRSPEVIDLLATPPSKVPFPVRIKALALSQDLEKKIFAQNIQLTSRTARHKKTAMLTANDEKELANEVLRYRHLFTERLLGASKFRQAALTVTQNIYLFKNRKIFFSTPAKSTESERQEALLLFTRVPLPTSIPLANTFQHLIIARIWNRIITQLTDQELIEYHFVSLLDAVVKLNTLRNIYVLLTTGLVKKIAARTNPLYKQSVTYEDAVQIGTLGIARAAYRYHPSSGIRFSTFAAHWIYREIQREALDGRLIRISTNIVEGYSKASKHEDMPAASKYSNIIESATTVDTKLFDEYATLSKSEFICHPVPPCNAFENSQLQHILLESINKVLNKKVGDIIRRRFGLPPYTGMEQSILSISKIYNVTRSSIYQLEQAALKKLHLNLREQIL